MSPEGEGWWVASDGRWYPPEMHPSRRAPAPPSGSPGRAQPLGRGIGTAVMVLLLATAALNGLTSVLGFALSSAAARYAKSGSRLDLENWVSAEDAYFGAAGIALLVWVATFVVLIIWLAKAHTSTSSLLENPNDRKYSRGWCIGVWFIPFANLFSTPKVFAEMQRIAYAERDNGRAAHDWRAGRLDPKLVWWWILFVGGIIVSRAGESMATANGPIDEYQSGLNISAIGTLVSAAGAATGAMFIRSVSGRLHDGMQDPGPLSGTSARAQPAASEAADWPPPPASNQSPGQEPPTRPALSTAVTPHRTRDRPRPSLNVRPHDHDEATTEEST